MREVSLVKEEKQKLSTHSEPVMSRSVSLQQEISSAQGSAIVLKTHAAERSHMETLQRVRMSVTPIEA